MAIFAVRRVAGRPVKLHYTWAIIAALITLLLSSHFAATNPGWTAGLRWALAAVTALLFFLTVLLHELAHAIVALGWNAPVRSILRFALRGVAPIDRTVETPRAEVWIAVSGPLTSAAIGTAAVLAARQLGWTLEEGAVNPLAVLLGWLGSINLMIAAFNLIPGYPLDGSRILRAILWSALGDVDRATQLAARVGQFVAAVFIFLGLFLLLCGAGFAWLWLIFIGWLLFSAARTNFEEVAVTASLRGVRAIDLMSTEYDTVNSETRLDLVAGMMRTGHPCFMVIRDDAVIGVIAPKDIGHVDWRRWPTTEARDAMRPLNELYTIGPDTPAGEALTVMARENINHLPVLCEGRLTGIVTRASLLRLMQIRSAVSM